MTQIRDLFLGAADSAAKLLAAPEVAAAWDEPSALPKFGVRGLAGHLALQVFSFPRVLAEPVPAEETISLREFYARAQWVGSDVDDEYNVDVRDLSEKEATDGPSALVAHVEATLGELRVTLPGAPSRPVRRSQWGPWSIGLDDFVTTRLLEVVVHSDDLAHSVGLPMPEFSSETVETVVDVLSRIAIHRHGPANVIRALSRAERAPASITAI